jgi:hypothetical protein
VTAAEYRQMIVQARKEQLRATADNVRRLERTYNAAAENMAAQLVNLPGYMMEQDLIRQAYLRTVMLNLGTVLENLRRDFGDLLDISTLDSAQMAADREAKLETLMTNAPARDDRLLAMFNRTAQLTDGQSIMVSFGRVAQSAVEATASRVYRDGLRLSDRLYNLDAAGKKVVEDTVIQGIAEGTSARDMAARLVPQLTEAGAANPKYQAMRIARTEINAAYREAHIKGAMTQGGVLKPYLIGVRWNLSLAAHKQADICDVYAAHDEGLGPGVYQPLTVPSEHPHGLCVTVSVLREYPDVGLPQRTPDVGTVPQSQVDYYAAQGDAPARALQQARLTAEATIPAAAVGAST